MRIEKLKAELSKARGKASEWQARAKDIERQITELENTEILQMVRGVAASPEELRALLDQIRAAKEPPQAFLVKKEDFERETEND